MEYILEIKFEDKSYNSIIHFVTKFTVETERNAQELVNELIEGFKRREIMVLSHYCTRIDDDAERRERHYEYYRFCISRATATVKIEQFILDNPNQNKSLGDNLTDKLLNGENSTAIIGSRYKIPVRVTEKDTKNIITGEFFYCTIEQLIPQNEE